MKEFMDCRSLANKMKAEARDIFAKDTATNHALAIIQVGNDPASNVYVRGKLKDCEECGINGLHYQISADMPADYMTDRIINMIKELNLTDSVYGIMIQLPVPDSIKKSLYAMVNLIDPKKDVDGMGDTNVAALTHQMYQPYHTPCTPNGIIRLLDEYDIDLESKDVVIIGRSNIVGKPMAAMLTERNATVQVCHSHTNHLYDKINRADIVISAAGCPNLIDGDNPELHLDNKILVDVGINRLSNGHLVGDINPNCASRANVYQTPVPGGIGLLTRAALMLEVAKSIKYFRL